MDNSTTSPSRIFPESNHYRILSTPNSGRGVFASFEIAADTLIHDTSPYSVSSSCESLTSLSSPKTSLSPLAWLIQRTYRKEACAYCFMYNRGREWKLKVENHDCGVVFCSDKCRTMWLAWNGNVGVQAWEALEKGIKIAIKRGVDSASNSVGKNFEMQNKHGDNDADGKNRRHKGLLKKEVDDEWARAGLIGEVIINARMKAKPTKNEKKVMRNVAEQVGDPDLMYYLLTAVVGAYNVAHEMERTETEDQQQQLERKSNGIHENPEHLQLFSTPTSPSIPTITSLLSPLFTLTPTLAAYTAHNTSLRLYTTSYLYLLSLLPTPLIPYLTPLLSHNLNTRAAHNAFSIRPDSSLDGPDSGEFLGWAVFPSASFFNHSCVPNLLKKRTGRVWEFRTKRKVKKGEELCITYLGGEEEVLDAKERRKRLMDEWEFGCMCEKCTQEEGEEDNEEK